MEKKTIGKFIAVLRKASGMTQKELGDKLFVSDKTVSRWERDECTPELSLIPAIAELFGVTADELLRGERITAQPDPDPKPHGKGEKQFKAMLHRRTTRFQNLSLIALGVGFLGVIAALICDVGFTRGAIGFFLALAFCAAGVICQLCFAANSILRFEEDDPFRAEMEAANRQTVRHTLRVLTALLAMLAFCLPLAAVPGYYGLDFGAWMLFGSLCAAGSLLLVHLLDVLFLHAALVRRGLLAETEEQQARRKVRKVHLKRTVLACAIVALVLGGGILAVNIMGWEPFAAPLEFDSTTKFSAYMEAASYAKWRSDNGYGEDAFSNPQDPLDPDGDGYQDFYWEALGDSEDPAALRYLCYDGLRISQVTVEETKDGRTLIRVYDDATLRDAWWAQSDVLSALCWLLLVWEVVCVLIYAVQGLSSRRTRRTLTAVLAAVAVVAAVGITAASGLWETASVEPSFSVNELE